jgi:hypothetical protein
MSKGSRAQTTNTMRIETLDRKSQIVDSLEKARGM